MTRQPFKFIASLIVGGSVYKLTGQIIDHNVDEPEKFTDKVSIRVTRATVGGIVAAKAERYTSDAIDLIADSLNEIKAAFKKQ